MMEHTPETVKYLDSISTQIRRNCLKFGWKSDWQEGGCYLHLETSEFIESLRGKHGDPTGEAADILFVLLGMCENHNIKMDDVLYKLEETLTKQKYSV